jgi:hypothetical protein
MLTPSLTPAVLLYLLSYTGRESRNQPGKPSIISMKIWCGIFPTGDRGPKTGIISRISVVPCGFVTVVINQIQFLVTHGKVHSSEFRCTLNFELN